MAMTGLARRLSRRRTSATHTAPTDTHDEKNLADMMQQARKFFSAHNYKTAADLFRVVVTACRELWGVDCRESITASSNLGTSLYFLGRLDEAGTVQAQVRIVSVVHLPFSSRIIHVTNTQMYT
jgi:hypothetical protein